MKYEEIKTPEELLEFMASSLKYGVIDDNGNIYTLRSNDFEYGCTERWKLKSPDELLEKRYGLCIDQVEFERKWFLDHGFKVKTILISMDLDGDSTHAYHTYLLFYENNKWNLFEHADTNNAGIYSFTFLNEAIIFQMNNHIDTNRQFTQVTDENINSIKLYEYDTPKFGIGIYDFAKHAYNSKDITDAIIVKEV